MTNSGDIKKRIIATPGIGAVARRASAVRHRRDVFPGSADYWEARYAKGGNSGEGSYGMWADHKAEYLNSFVRTHDVASVIEWGCGDGNQLTLADYPNYVGVDVSDTAIAQCINRFADDKSKSFYGLRTFTDNAGLFAADLSMSLDVIYHLVEDRIFHAYMQQLFDSAKRYVIIYATVDGSAGRTAPHVRHRDFRPWVDANAPGWEFVERVERQGKAGSAEADFVAYRKI